LTKISRINLIFRTRRSTTPHRPGWRRTQGQRKGSLRNHDCLHKDESTTERKQNIDIIKEFNARSNVERGETLERERRRKGQPEAVGDEVGITEVGNVGCRVGNREGSEVGSVVGL
jgi:hypothetical protein